MNRTDSRDKSLNSDSYRALCEKIESRRAIVGVIGLGYVGLPLAYALHEGGLPILGFDIDPEKPKALAEGRNYLKHLGETLSHTLSTSERFEATTDLVDSVKQTYSWSVFPHHSGRIVSPISHMYCKPQRILEHR